MKAWFEQHHVAMQRLDDLLSDLWDDTFVDWLRTYLADNTETPLQA